MFNKNEICDNTTSLKGKYLKFYIKLMGDAWYKIS